MNLLLDTHILVWWIEGHRKLPVRCRRVLDREAQRKPLWLSDVSLWEIAMLVLRGRLELTLPVRDWLERASAPPRVAIVSITPAIAAESAVLPDWDPPDRIIVASARVLGATLVTLDERIRESGLVSVL